MLPRPIRQPASFRHLSAGLVGLAVAGLLGQACKSKPPRAVDPLGVVRCAPDESREYVCEELLPRTSAKPAPEPYDNCPSFVEHAEGQLSPGAVTADFDPQYTEYTRKRMPPGHSCCFSWCAKLAIADPEEFDPYAACSDPLAIRETLCVEAPEAGTSGRPGPAPFDACPAAIHPPAGASFSVPRGAILDLESSGQRRAEGSDHCCYSWCSVAPGGTGVQGKE